VNAFSDLAPAVTGTLGVVHTDRLMLRPFEPDDLDAIAAVFAKEEVWRFPYGRGYTQEESAAFVARQAEHWELCGFGLWLATEKATDDVIGYVGLSVPTFLPEILPAVEVGWRLDPGAWGRGFATEGASAALEQAFTTLGLQQVCSIPETENIASIRVEERLGMQLERNVVLPATVRRGKVEALLYVMMADDWSTRR
jgi:RimJ/RimL family protein N-acetyltransferase